MSKLYYYICLDNNKPHPADNGIYRISCGLSLLLAYGSNCFDISCKYQ